MELIASDENRARFSLDRPIVVYSRKVLNGLLLDRAAIAGCKIAHAHVSGVTTINERPQLQTVGDMHEFDFVVIASGARNTLFPEVEASSTHHASPIKKEDRQITLGYYIPVESSVLKIKFVKGLQGYVWSFPRPGHLSVGVCASMARHSMGDVRDVLEAFLTEENLNTSGEARIRHVLQFQPRQKK